MKPLMSKYFQKPAKITIVFIFLIGFISNHSHSSEFRTVEDFLTSGQKMDFFTVGQVTNRCAGLFGAIGRFLPSGKDKDDLITLSSRFLEKSFQVLTHERKNAAEQIGEKLLSDIKYYNGVYEGEMERHQRDTGSIFSPAIKTEVFWCKELANRMLNR
jgi:hypothetical protein